MYVSFFLDIVLKKCEIMVDNENIEINVDEERGKNCFNIFKYKVKDFNNNCLLSCIKRNVDQNKVGDTNNINNLENVFESKSWQLTNSSMEKSDSSGNKFYNEKVNSQDNDQFKSNNMNSKFEMKMIKENK